MNHLLEIIVRISRAAIGLAFCVLIGAVLIQVLGRSVFSNSPVWTEELTRFALLFLAAFGAGLSFRSGDLVNVDIVSESAPGRWPWRMRLIGAVVTAAMCALLIGPAWKYTSIGALQTSPALGWRMDYIHVSVLVLILSLMIFSAARAVLMMLGQSDGLPENRLDEPPL
ncbi:TRAP transporter small permease subunit [Stappia sp. GBMRC 2046]|uniref:TRAP transporter small permease protein n=1 Tax=Stappia sediminis TaxID=2692190 RepID=A0A7X3LWB9_9HYPH|nr:TRAP transporter small permease [Stappia sediminis]MXN66334.1 TRAP transporter small permease subunit [Stappia sediminis]